MSRSKEHEEIWKPIQHLIGTEFGSHYEVSSQGRVRSLPRTVEGRWGQQKLKGGLLKLTKTGGDGKKKTDWRLAVGLSCGGEGTLFAVSRLVHEAFIGPVNPGWLIHPKNWDRADMRAANLVQISSRQELSDLPGFNRRTGVHHRWTVLSEKQKEIIRTSPETENRLAALLRVHRVTIRRVRKGGVMYGSRIDSFWLEDVTLGEDSRSGLAMHAVIEGEEYWIPYSCIRKIERKTTTVGEDRVEVDYWWAKEKELAE